MLLLLSQMALAQSLVNGDFETGAEAPWSMWGEIARVENIPGVPRSGDYVGNIILLGNTGAYEQGGMWQDVAAVGGDRYVRGTVWVRSGDFSPLVGDTVVELVHENYNSSGFVVTRPVDATTDLPQGEWRCLEILGQTPTTTDFVRTAVLITSVSSGSGGIWVDDVSFEVGDTPFDPLCPVEGDTDDTGLVDSGDTDDTDDTDEPLDGEGGQGNDDPDDGASGRCDCDAGRAPIGALTLLLPLIGLRRRR